MPFDFTNIPELTPATRKLAPNDRLIALRDWLYAGGPGMERWDYGELMCGTVGCAAGWYRELTGIQTSSLYPVLMVEFDLTVTQLMNIFENTESIIANKDRLKCDHVQPRHVANVIDLVLHEVI